MNHNHMKIHELKYIEPYFSQIEDGIKTFELRFNDRNFHTGDYLLLKRYDFESLTYSGNSVLVRVKASLKDFSGIEKGYCVMSISKPLE